MNRTQFTFYESFFQSLQRIRSREERADAYDAICAYALYGTEPDLDGLTDTAAVAFMLVRPNLDASKRKAESGKLGGSKPKANRRQDPRENKNENKNKNKKETENEVEDECHALPGGGEDRARSVPTLEQVREAAGQRGCPELARDFFDYYSAAGWRDREGRPVRSWRQALVAWQLREEKSPKPRRRKSWVEVAEEMEAEERLAGMLGSPAAAPGET